MRPIWAGMTVRSPHAGLPLVPRCERVLPWCPVHFPLHSPLLWHLLCPCNQQYHAVSLLLTLGGKVVRFHLVLLASPPFHEG